MKITELSPYKGTTWQITTENGGKIFIGQRTVEKMNLKKGMELPDSAIESIKEEDLERKSRERAMYLLSGRDYGFVELYRKLEKTYPKEMCLRTCKLMAEKGLVNDREYAFRLGKQLFEIKKESAVAVRYKLTQKGIPKDIIGEVIDAYCEDDEVVKDRIKALVEKKYKRNLTDEAGIRKVKNALARLGYGYSDINSVLKEFDNEEEY
ncbi:MAG: recombination regulator RecX [Oscillospiraceae bacterium]|nr:recombination regulator RecX [Oscillospiraceae bacterium]